MIREIENAVFSRAPHTVEPVLGHAIVEKLVIGHTSEQRRQVGLRRRVDFNRSMNEDFLDALTDFDDLRCASARVGFDPATLCPFIGVIMVINIANQYACTRFVNDDANITINSNGPKIFILRLINTMKL